MFTGTATPKLELPQWEPTDHPDFLTDINTAFQKIDENAGATEESVEEIAEIRDNVSNLQALTQSLNEDSQEMLGEIAAINVALGNLRTETDKVEPIRAQVLGLQEIARRQSDEINKLKGGIFDSSVWNGNVTVNNAEGNVSFRVMQIVKSGAFFRITIGMTAGYVVPVGSHVLAMDSNDWNSIRATLKGGGDFTEKVVYSFQPSIIIDNTGANLGVLACKTVNNETFELKYASYRENAINHILNHSITAFVSDLTMEGVVNDESRYSEYYSDQSVDGEL